MPRAFLVLLTLAIASVALAAAKEPPKKPAEKRELLSNHETLAVFEEVKFRECLGRTSRCPKDCGDSGEFAVFSIINLPPRRPFVQVTP